MYAGAHAGAGAPAAWPSAVRASSYTTKQVPLAGTLRASAGPKPRYRPAVPCVRRVCARQAHRSRMQAERRIGNTQVKQVPPQGIRMSQGPSHPWRDVRCLLQRRADRCLAIAATEM